MPWVPAGHFYSPMVDPTDPNVVKVLETFSDLELPQHSGICLDVDAMKCTMKRLARHYGRLPYTSVKHSDHQYYYENPSFSYGDAIILALMMLEFRPKRLVEVGSGFSSCAIIDMNDKELKEEVELTFIDPYPETLLALLPAHSHYRGNIVSRPVQDVPLEVFQQLSENDILFIDSSHVAKMGSDVNFLVFNIFPILNPGVLIHIHDIPYPFEYSPNWIIQENRSWNEVYLIRAFLQFNDAFDIVFYNHLATRNFPDKLLKHLPLFLKNGGASLWMKRRHFSVAG